MKTITKKVSRTTGLTGSAVIQSSATRRLSGSLHGAQELTIELTFLSGPTQDSSVLEFLRDASMYRRTLNVSLDK